MIFSVSARLCACDGCPAVRRGAVDKAVVLGFPAFLFFMHSHVQRKAAAQVGIFLITAENFVKSCDRGKKIFE